MTAMTPFLLSLAVTAAIASAQTTRTFDGRPWNVSTGNLSVTYIQASPIGAHPKPNFLEPPPSIASLSEMRTQGLVADEDYIAWGAVERAPGQWDWRQHDAMEAALHQAGLKYVVYDWAHFPPLWLRDGMKDGRTLMRCLEHGEETNYLSIFDPRTIEWYDHFYRAVHDHFGNRVDDIYACILGPYGEGNCPIPNRDWIDMGHCHEGYWCGDDHALAAFRTAMKGKYETVDALNRAWDTAFENFASVAMPEQIRGGGFVPKPEAFPTPQARRRWLDFITWYHQAIVDFAEKSLQALLKYYPAGKVRMKPGGNAGGVNPIAWGTYCPGYAKMAARYGVTLQPADCQGAVFGDKWLATAYQFYGVRLSTEPAGELDRDSFLRRIFSDVSCGAAQLFTYEFPAHAADIRQYAHLYTGHPGETEIAVLCPTTLYRLGGDLGPTIAAAHLLRDLCEFDVLDELLVADGALDNRRYGVLILTQPDIIDQPILDKIDAFAQSGGTVIAMGDGPMRNVEGAEWQPAGTVKRIHSLAETGRWQIDLSNQLSGRKGCDGRFDGIWTCRRGDQVVLYNARTKPARTKVDGAEVEVPAHALWSNR